MSRRRTACWPYRVVAGLCGIVIAGVGCSCATSAGADHSGFDGTRGGAASCAGLTARQEFKAAHWVFDGTMLPGPIVKSGERRVLSSPARVRVIRYLKGRGPHVVHVQTAVTPTTSGVREDAEGILPMVGQRWRIYADRARQPLPTSVCNGSRRIRRAHPADRQQ